MSWGSEHHLSDLATHNVPLNALRSHCAAELVTSLSWIERKSFGIISASQSGKQTLLQSSNQHWKPLAWEHFGLVSQHWYRNPHLRPWWKLIFCLLWDHTNPTSAICVCACVRVSRDLHSYLSDCLLLCPDSGRMLLYGCAWGGCLLLSSWYECCLWFCVCWIPSPTQCLLLTVTFAEAGTGQCPICPIWSIWD